VCIRELLFGYSIAIAADFFLHCYHCCRHTRVRSSPTRDRLNRVVSMVDVFVYSVSAYLMILTVLLVFLWFGVRQS
jgi:hypothetical protein